MTDAGLAGRADAVRRFNRFYTRHIDLLQEGLHGSPFSLTEVRILYELAHRPGRTAADLCRELGLNAGYVSRVISGFARKRLLRKSRSETDARLIALHLTDKGRATLQPLESAARSDMMRMLARVSTPEQFQVVEAMNQIEAVLGAREPGYLLRDPQPGDMGWIIHRQTVLYAQEYGWNGEYEALVAEIIARFMRGCEPTSERCWIAEKNGKVVGSVFLVREDRDTARLRLLYVDPCARGLGIGGRLVDECLRFARLAGYRRIVLWTNSVLTGARRIYERAGFQLVEESPHHSFGKDLVGQTWARDV